ncbi:hypothetical protein LWI28_015379 [Acer negundo]|uniref:Uncharacterized protein n=1 Tax=Acer negundo TaxID=4023 RepID=A0AAD5IIK9_ACENE|nr:hypothetical protein LWI28_015379 [Acer negundo]
MGFCLAAHFHFPTKSPQDPFTLCPALSATVGPIPSSVSDSPPQYTVLELHHLGSTVLVEPSALPCANQARPCAAATPHIPTSAAAPHVLTLAIAAPPLSPLPMLVPTYHMITRLRDSIRQPKIYTDGTIRYPLSQAYATVLSQHFELTCYT